MKKQYAEDNLPIHDLLEKLGYRFVCSCEDRTAKAEFKWKTPHGEIRRLKYQKRSGDGGVEGRYLVGIAYNRFDDVDDFVFWAEGEKYLLIVPTERLKAIFDTNRHQLKKTDKQWHVNIFFDSRGFQAIHPVYCEREDISKYAHSV